MKALSILQPYASLIIWGDKKYETRGWATSYRGTIAICSGKSMTEIKYLQYNQLVVRPYTYEDYALQSYRKQGVMRLTDVPFGFILGTVQLVDCIPTHKLIHSISRKERVFGGYEGKRYAWQLEDVQPFKTPIPVRGQLGLFDIDLKGIL